MLDVESIKVIVDECGKTKFQKIHPFKESLESLIAHVVDLEKSNDSLRKTLNEYSKDKEIQKYKKEAENTRINSLYMLDDDERKRADEFNKEHYKKCGKAGYIRYILTPTGIGTVVEVECARCKDKKDISNFNNW